MGSGPPAAYAAQAEGMLACHQPKAPLSGVGLAHHCLVADVALHCCGAAPCLLLGLRCAALLPVLLLSLWVVGVDGKPVAALQDSAGAEQGSRE